MVRVCGSFQLLRVGEIWGKVQEKQIQGNDVWFELSGGS